MKLHVRTVSATPIRHTFPVKCTNMKYYPMLASTGDESLLGSTRYQYEPKLDGQRCLVYINNGKVTLMSRTGKDMTPQFPEIVNSIACRVSGEFVFDGEIVVLTPDGNTDFQALQTRMQRLTNVVKSIQVYKATFIAFDVLVMGNLDVMYLPLSARRQILMQCEGLFSIIDTLQPLEVQDYYDTIVWTGVGEGVMAKLLTSPYLHAERSKHWMKIKPTRETTLCIGGCTWGIGKRASTFAALLLGESSKLSPDGVAHYGTPLSYQGSVGTGFNDEQLQSLMILLQDRKTTESPFIDYPLSHPQADKVRLYCEPTLRARVRYQEKTADGKLRFPSFLELVWNS